MPFKLGGTGAWGGAEELPEDPSVASFHFTSSSNIIFDPTSAGGKRKSGQQKLTKAKPARSPSSNDGPQLTSSAKRRLRRKKAMQQKTEESQDKPAPTKRNLPQDQGGKRRKLAALAEQSEEGQQSTKVKEPGKNQSSAKQPSQDKKKSREEFPSVSSKKNLPVNSGKPVAQKDKKTPVKEEKKATSKPPSNAAFAKPLKIAPTRPPPLPAQPAKHQPSTSNTPNQAKSKAQPGQKVQSLKTLSVPQPSKLVAKSPPATKADQFRQKLQKKLGAAHFRWLNEQLYTQNSGASVKLFRDDPSLFTAYHSGFQDQVARWPANPVDIYIERLQGMDSRLVVADFGCGEAKLAQSVPQTVRSFDLVAVNEHVTVADSSHVPLQRNSVDIAVFCLALMGSNYMDSVKEAHRVLRKKGILWIAEVKSRFGDGDTVEAFVSAVEALGFHLTASDTRNKMFVTFDLDKSPPGKPCEAPELKPCFYKRR